MVMDIVKEADKVNGCLPADRLRSLIERIERLMCDVDNIKADIKDIYTEAKSVGFDVKIMRQIIKLRKMDAASRDEADFLLDEYRKALDI